MSGFMLHGLGDCTPELNCGCIPKLPPDHSWLETECLCRDCAEKVRWFHRVFGLFS